MDIRPIFTYLLQFISDLGDGMSSYEQSRVARFIICNTVERRHLRWITTLSNLLKKESGLLRQDGLELSPRFKTKNHLFLLVNWNLTQLSDTETKFCKSKQFSYDFQFLVIRVSSETIWKCKSHHVNLESGPKVRLLWNERHCYAYRILDDLRSSYSSFQPEIETISQR